MNQESISNLEICLRERERGEGENQRTARGEMEGVMKGSAVWGEERGTGATKGRRGSTLIIIIVLIYSQLGRSAISSLQLSMGILW